MRPPTGTLPCLQMKMPANFLQRACALDMFRQPQTALIRCHWAHCWHPVSQPCPREEPIQASMASSLDETHFNASSSISNLAENEFSYRLLAMLA